MEVILTVILLSFLKTAWSDLFCSDLLKPKDQHFYPLRHCQRSNKAEISATNVVSVEKCAQYAESNDALAFNYGHGRKPKNETSNHDLINLFEIVANKNKTKNDEENTWIDIKPYFNCQILSCPEIGNLSGMINDTRYDYYTLYANPIREFIHFYYVFSHLVKLKTILFITCSAIECNMFTIHRIIYLFQ